MAMVMVIAAVLVYMSIRFLRPAEAQAFQQAERLRDDIRLIQVLALTWDQPLRLTLVSTSRYEVCCLDAAMTACTTGAAPCTNPALHPGTKQAFGVDLQDGLTFSATAALEFDRLGRPCNGAALRTANVSFDITGGAGTRSVIVAPITGFATVQ